MPDALVLLPLLALTLPGILAYLLGRRFQSHWPGLILAALALGSGAILLWQAAGSEASEAGATNRVLAAFALSFPALISAAVGGVFAHLRRK